MESAAIPTAIAFIEKYIPEAMRDAKTPGCSLALVRGGEIVYESGFGWRDLERSLPATPDTLCGIGSCSKAVAATAILLLEEQHALSLDDPIDRYVPFKLRSPRGPITIHHFLTHSSGLPALSTSEILIQKGLGVDRGFPLASSEDFYRWVNGAQGEMTAELGERFFYCNEGYRMLGHIVQTVAGMPFHDVVAERILKPLGMRRSSYVRSVFEQDPDHMQPYLTKPDGAIAAAPFPYPDVASATDFSFMLAAGGLVSSVHEMTSFLASNFAASPTRLLSATSLARMQHSYLTKSMSPYGPTGYGYGWTFTENFLGVPMVAHGGSIDVATAYTAFLPHEELGAIIVANASGMPHSTIVEGVFAAFLGHEPFDAIPSLVSTRRMSSYSGNYETYRGANRARVFSKAGMLYLEQKDDFQEMVVPLIPEDAAMANHRFYILTDGVRQPAVFEPTPDGFDLYVERNRYHKVKCAG